MWRFSGDLFELSLKSLDNRGPSVSRLFFLCNFRSKLEFSFRFLKGWFINLLCFCKNISELFFIYMRRSYDLFFFFQ